jgi:ribonuclease HII
MPDFSLEHRYPYKIVAGVDEAGRGPLVGPVFAGAVIIDQSCIIEGINDSKKLSEKKREEIYQAIIQNYAYGIGSASVREINEINILEATKLACKRAIEAIPLKPDVVLVDGNMRFPDTRYISIVRGDQISVSIAAASIVAKVSRDALMRKLSLVYPEYAWDQNKGYGTKAHLDALQKYGRTEHHRHFKYPIKSTDSLLSLSF